MGAERVGVGCRSRTKTDDGDDLLAEPFVGHADDRSFGDVRMLVERGLDFGGVDVLAASDDDVLQPVDDIEVAVFVETAERRRCGTSRR